MLGLPYRDTSLIRNHPPLGSYSTTMPGSYGGARVGGQFLKSVVTLNKPINVPVPGRLVPPNCFALLLLLFFITLEPRVE
jgi:hypothetical protein